MEKLSVKHQVKINEEADTAEAHSNTGLQQSQSLA